MPLLRRHAQCQSCLYLRSNPKGFLSWPLAAANTKRQYCRGWGYCGSVTYRHSCTGPYVSGLLLECRTIYWAMLSAGRRLLAYSHNGGAIGDAWSSYSAPMPVEFWLWVAPNVAQSHVYIFFLFYTFEPFLNLNQFQKWITFRNNNFLIQMFIKSIPFKFEQILNLNMFSYINKFWIKTIFEIRTKFKSK
jgi:hypothetical protein